MNLSVVDLQPARQLGHRSLALHHLLCHLSLESRTEMDPVSWTGLRLSQARVQLLIPIIAAPGPANFFFPSTPPQELRIALCFCDPHLNKLKGVTSGSVSQTRVCDTTQPRQIIHTDRSGSDQKLIREPSLQVSSPMQAGGTMPVIFHVLGDEERALGTKGNDRSSPWMNPIRLGRGAGRCSMCGVGFATFEVANQQPRRQTR